MTLVLVFVTGLTFVAAVAATLLLPLENNLGSNLFLAFFASLLLLMIRLVFCSSYKTLLLLIPLMLITGFVGMMAGAQAFAGFYAAAILMGIMLGARAVIDTFRKQPKKPAIETFKGQMRKDETIPP